MAVTVKIRPNIVMDPTQFESQFSGYTLAADGIVSARSFIKKPEFLSGSYRGPYANEDHHYNCDRSNVGCSAVQTVDDIRNRSLDCFELYDEFCANILLNHVDMDGLMVFEAAKRYDEIKRGTIDPSFYRLLHLENVMDTTAGFCDLDTDSTEVMELAWVSEPTLALANGNLEKVGEAGWMRVINEVSRRVSAYMRGSPGKIRLDTSYVPLHEGVFDGKKLVVIENPGPYAQLRLFQEGVDVYAIIRESEDGFRKATIGKTSPSVAYSVEAACCKLNLLEDKKDHSYDCWDGTGLVSGSSRKTGTTLESRTLFQNMAELC